LSSLFRQQHYTLKCPRSLQHIVCRNHEYHALFYNDSYDKIHGKGTLSNCRLLNDQCVTQWLDLNEYIPPATLKIARLSIEIYKFIFLLHLHHYINLLSSPSMDGVTIFIRFVGEGFFVYGDLRHHAHALSNR